MGLALKAIQTSIYALLFCCSIIVLGIYSYFLATLRSNGQDISDWKRAVEGLAGSAALYCLFAVLLTCFLGAKGLFAFLALFLDLLFAGVMVAVAILTRRATSKCSGIVNTPLGVGPASRGDPNYGVGGFGLGSADYRNYRPKLALACRMNKACFAVAVIAAFFFLVAALIQLLLHREHRRDKRYGPSPANNYTSGAGRRAGLFRRKNRDGTALTGTRDAEVGTVGTATTAVEPTTTSTTYKPANPYGYDNTRTNATNY